ncbi:MAG: cobalamin-binding protein [Anaerolineales bacterium]|nr:cobalamin-binding protein [Anaerolineales bacterium]
MKLEKLIGSLLLFSLLLAACGAPAVDLPAPQVEVEEGAAPEVSAGSFPLLITDDMGREITLEAPAARIVSLAPSNTELLYALGAGSQVVGRDAYSDYPAETANTTDIGDTFGALNTEVIASLDPDLVLAAGITPPEQIASLEALGITVFWLGNPEDFEGLYENIYTVGLLTGRGQEANDLAANLQDRIAAVDDALTGLTETPSVFYELDASDPAAPWTSGAGTFIDLIINRAGGRNAAAGLQGDFAQFSIEELLVQNPDVIVLGDANYGVTPELVAQRAGWDALAAVQNSRVYPYDDNLISRPGPRLVDALEQLARLLHPDRFSP